MGPMNGGMGPMGMMPPLGLDNPYMADVHAAQQRIARLRDRLGARAAARRALQAGRDGEAAEQGPGDHPSTQVLAASSSVCSKGPLSGTRHMSHWLGSCMHACMQGSLLCTLTFERQFGRTRRCQSLDHDSVPSAEQEAACCCCCSLLQGAVPAHKQAAMPDGARHSAEPRA